MFLFRKGFIDGRLGRPKGTDTIRNPRRATRRAATVLWAGHSLVQTAYGNPIGDNGAVDPFGGILDVNWPGSALSDYVSYGSMEAVRNLSGHLLNSDYNALIVSEFTDPSGSGYPALDSGSGRNTLQQAYWDGLNAAERGAELILQDVWSPAGSDLDSNVRGFFQGLREWLQLHLGRPVWIIPANPFVAALRNAYGNAIYEDGLHLGRSSAYARGMSYLVYSFLRQERCPFVVAGDEAIDQLAWDTVTTYECAGMGGATAYASALPGTDPLPNPLPLPETEPEPEEPDSALYLDDASAVISGLTISGRAKSGLTAGQPSSGRRAIAWPISWPVGTRIQMRAAHTGTGGSLFLRVGDTSDLGPSGQLDIAVALNPGQSADLDITLSASQAAKTWFGFLINNGSGAFTISDFRVTLPEAVPVAPSNTAAPVVTGTAQVGQQLATPNGAWTGDAPITYEYQWQSSANGSSGWATISGATAATFTPQAAQQELYIRTMVRATNAAGQSGWIASAAVGPVAAALAAPVRVSAPGIDGTFQVGQTLTASPLAVYSGNPAPTISYRWQMRPAGGGTITTLTTASQLQLALAQQDMQIRLQDMANNSQGSTGWISGAWSTPVAAAPVEPEPAGLEDMETARILFIGNSMTDSIFSGSADARQTFGKSHATAPLRFRKFTIPGSTQGITWDQRFGAPDEQPGAAAPFDPEDSQTIAYPGRDMAQFDAVCWSSAGPFPQLPDPDLWNDTYRTERNNFRNWSELCDLNGVRKYFLTFPPATDWLTFNQPSGWPALTDPDVYERYLTSQRQTAEEWVAEVDPAIVIIPKTELWREIHRRCVAGTFPGVSSGSTTPALQNDPPEMGLVIHPTHLGSIFEAAFVWRFLHGAHMADDRIADMLDDGSYSVTLAQVKEIVDASLVGYAQGTGYGISPPVGWAPGADIDFGNLAATVPALTITGTPGAGNALTAGNHAIGDMGAPMQFYAMLDITLADNDEMGPFVTFYQDQGGIWDPKYVGIVARNDINGLYVNYGSNSKQQAFTSGLRQVWEFTATPQKAHLHVVAPQESQGSPEVFDAEPVPAHRFGINAHEWIDGSENMNLETFAVGHTIHRGFVYKTYPDVVERLRLQVFMTGDYA